MSKLKFLLSAILLLGLVGCGSTQKKTVLVGVDPAFFPLELLGNEPAVLGFTNDLLEEISHIEKRRFERVNLAWDQLLEALQEHKVQGIVSSMYPYVFNLKKYAFSELFLLTGPVLVVPKASNIKNPENLRGSEIAILSQDNENLLTQLVPDVLPRMATSMAKALEDLTQGVYEAAFVDAIPAIGYVSDLYNRELEIISSPAGERGLRFVTGQGEGEENVKIFDSGLKQLMRSGKYQELLNKWKV